MERKTIIFFLAFEVGIVEITNKGYLLVYKRSPLISLHEINRIFFNILCSEFLGNSYKVYYF